jgi:hypothetical protein
MPIPKKQKNLIITPETIASTQKLAKNQQTLQSETLKTHPPIKKQATNRI